MKKPPSKPRPKLYTLHSHGAINGDHGYSQFFLHVMQSKQWSPEDYNTVLSFRWQSNADARWDWYGLRAEGEYSDGDIEKIMKAGAKVLEQVLNNGAEKHSRSPRSFIEALEKLGYVRAQYESRVHRYVAEADRIDPALQTWTDNADSKNCHVRALALTETDAIPALEKQWLSNLEHRHSSADDFAAWVTAGRPIRRGYRDDPAEYPALANLLFEHLKPAEEAAQQIAA